MVFFKKNYIQSFASYEFFSASPFLRVGPDREYGIRPMDELKRGKRRALWNVTNLTQLVSRPKKYSTSHIFRKLLIGSSHCYFFQIFKVVILVLSSGVRFNPHPVRSYPAFFFRGHFFWKFYKINSNSKSSWIYLKKIPVIHLCTTNSIMKTKKYNLSSVKSYGLRANSVRLSPGLP